MSTSTNPDLSGHLRTRTGRRRRRLIAAATAICIVAPTGSALSGPSEASAVLEWNATAGDAARAACLSPANDPLHEARMYAITHIAVHDALNSIDRRYEPYAYRDAAPVGTSVSAAVATAAHDAMVAALNDLPTELFPPETGCAQAGIDLVKERYAAALAGIPDGAAKTNGISVGQAAAAAIVSVRAADHANDAPLVDTAPRGGAPGEYQFTPGTPFAFAPKWGAVTPFVLRDSSQFASGPPHPLTSRRYATDFEEVKRLGGGGDGDPTPSARTVDQTQIALFWLESSPLAWNRLARAIVTGHELDDWETARLFGLLNMGMVDGYIGTFAEKYDYNFWRPVTAIHRAAEDGNPLTSPDPNWAAPRGDAADPGPRLWAQRRRWRGRRSVAPRPGNGPGRRPGVQPHAACRADVRRPDADVAVVRPLVRRSSRER